MKNKTNGMYERFQLLMKLQRHTSWLIRSDRPTKEKLAIWHKDFDKFVKELSQQDRKLAKG